MKTTFTAFGLATMGLLLTTATSSAETIGGQDFPGFTTRIGCRQATQDPGARILPKDPTALLKKKAPASASRFIGWNAAAPERPAFTRSGAENGQQLDSIVSVYLDGVKRSKQEFTFTENGRPNESRNFIPSEDGKSYIYVGHYLYEYDDLGRLICAEKTDDTYLSSNQKIEYVYEGSNPLYSIQIAYLMNEDAEWVPFQKGEYAFDDKGNTIEETYYSWNDEVSDWMPVQKVKASYNDIDLMTSYFKYLWDGYDWSNDANATDGHTYEYTQDGQDALETNFIWYDGAYLAYNRKTYSYNDAALCTKSVWEYWNREKQDWSGNETWGRWENLYTNSEHIYEYDELGRLTTLNVYTVRDGESTNYYREVYSYTPIENDELEQVMLRGSVKEGEFAPYSKTVQHFNSFGSETYYVNFQENNGELVPFQEEIRYMDEYNWFLGGDYYMFMNGERKPLSKERFTYPEDFDPTLPYETPIEGRHWIGTGMGDTAEWKLKQVDEFTWGPRDVMIGYVNYDYLQSDGFKTYGWENEFDFSTNMANVWLWPDPNKTKDYYENQLLGGTTYYNSQYWKGNTDWMPEISYHNTYYYSERKDSGVAAIAGTDAVEVARYDLMGRRIAQPTPGINIVRLSDGTSRKVLVAD